jgi:hypothetical protein
MIAVPMLVMGTELDSSTVIIWAVVDRTVSYVERIPIVAAMQNRAMEMLILASANCL